MSSQSSSSQGVPIESNITAPTPVNTPMNNAPISSGTGLSRPTVPDISEEADEDVEDKPGGEGALGDVASGGPLAQALQTMVSGKLSTLIGRSSGYVESLPVEVRRNVEALKGVQVQQVELQNQYKRECFELEKKYLTLQQPLFDRRHQLITGAAAPTKDEVEAGEKQSAKEDEAYTPLPAADEVKPAEIPEFWLTALRNHPGLSELITDRDAQALKYLIDIKLSYIPDSSSPEPAEGTSDKNLGFKLTFQFSPGVDEFFTNEGHVLTKTYLYQEEIGYGGDFVYERAIGTEIQWREGEKDLTKEWEIKKQRNKNTNRTRLVRKAKPAESFFNFFSPPVPLSEVSEELDEQDIEEIEENLEVDYQIGEDLKEKIIPRAIDYFTGKALEYELDDLDDEDDEDGDFEEFDEDSDDVDGEDSDDDAPRKRRKGGPKAVVANRQPTAEECKNQ